MQMGLASQKMIVSANNISILPTDKNIAEIKKLGLCLVHKPKNLSLLREYQEQKLNNKFGSYEWHLQHNFDIQKRNAQISFFNFKKTNHAFYLNDAISCTQKALKLKKQIKGF